MNLSDRIALFNNGRIEQVGTPETLYQSPETLFTARFLGDSTVFELVGEGSTSDSVDWEDRVWALDSRTVSTRAGARAALVVRPEDMRIAAGGETEPVGTNAVTATIRDIEYMGAYRTAVLALGRQGVVGRVRLDARETDLKVGESVVAWWPVERQRLVTA